MTVNRTLIEEDTRHAAWHDDASVLNTSQCSKEPTGNSGTTG